MANAIPPWQAHPVARLALDHLLDAADRAPLTERKRDIGFRVNAEKLPALFNPQEAGDADFAWRQILRLVEEGWIRLDRTPRKDGYAPWETNPYLRLVGEREVEIRAALGRPGPEEGPSARWRAALAAAKEAFPGDIGAFLGQPLIIPGLSTEAVVERLRRLPALSDETLYLREASARAFDGLSKVLDNRADAIAQLLGMPECPFPEAPILLHVHLPASVDGYLFIENEVTFLAAAANRIGGTFRLGLIFASGFKGAARRLRDSAGSRVFWSESGVQGDGAKERFLAWLREGNPSDPVYFWGDLDYSGMAILKRLREVFPNLEAWRPGYGTMLTKVQSGEGHAPLTASKEGQLDPGVTGCAFADEQLLPALREMGRFLDQEGIRPTESLVALE